MMLRCGLNPLSESMSITFQPVIGDWYGPYFFPLDFRGGKEHQHLALGPGHQARRSGGPHRHGHGDLHGGGNRRLPKGGPRVMSFSKNGDFSQLLGEYVDPETTYATGGKPIARNDAPDNGQTRMDVLVVEQDGTAEHPHRGSVFRSEAKGQPGGSRGMHTRRAEAHHGFAAARHRLVLGPVGMMEIYDALDLPMLIRRKDFSISGTWCARSWMTSDNETRQAVSMEFAVRPVHAGDAGRQRESHPANRATNFICSRCDRRRPTRRPAGAP